MKTFSNLRRAKPDAEQSPEISADTPGRESGAHDSHSRGESSDTPEMIDLKNESYAEWRARMERQWWADNYPALVLAVFLFFAGFGMGAVWGSNKTGGSPFLPNHSGQLLNQASVFPESRR